LAEEGAYSLTSNGPGSLTGSSESEVIENMNRANFSTAGSKQFWEKDGFKQVKDMAVTSATLTGSVFGAVAGFHSSEESPSSTGMFEHQTKWNIENVFGLAVNGFIASAVNSGDATYLQYADNLEAQYQDLVKASYTSAANTTALAYVHKFIAPDDGVRRNEGDLDPTAFDTLDAEEGFWKSLGLTVTRSDTVFENTGEFFVRNTYKTTFTIADGEVDLAGISDFKYTAYHEHVDHFIGGGRDDQNFILDFSVTNDVA
jgi:hypothetical protein